MLNHGVVSSLIETVPLSSSSESCTTSIFSERSSLTTNSSWGDSDDENDVLFFPLMQYLMSGSRRHRIENYLFIIESWTELEFKEHLRLSRNIAYQLIDEIETSGYMPQHCFGMKPISGKLSVLIFLWYMANTEPLRTISDRFDVSISSAFRIIRRVIAWILTKSNVTIKWPETHNSISVVTDGFFRKKGLSNVLGAIDCTHIRIKKPSTNEKDYYNRKKFCSINLQAVVDSNMRFTNVYCGEPGSLHDARVLRRSSLYEEANKNKEALFPNNTFIIGDSAYPSLPWLVPPFRDNGHLTPQQTEFNYLHSSTRMAVEKAFGQLKGRFRRIKFFTEYKDIRFITNTVMAACILHNLCINEKDNFDMDENDDQFHIDNAANFFQENVNDEIPTDRRMQLFRELFPEN